MDADLVHMKKGEEVLEVHPSCVAAHERAGWAVVPAPEPAPESQSKGGKAAKKE